MAGSLADIGGAAPSRQQGAARDRRGGGLPRRPPGYSLCLTSPASTEHSQLASQHRARLDFMRYLHRYTSVLRFVIEMSALCREVSQLSIDAPFAYFRNIHSFRPRNSRHPVSSHVRTASIVALFQPISSSTIYIQTYFTRLLTVSTGQDTQSHLPHNTLVILTVPLAPQILAAGYSI